MKTTCHSNDEDFVLFDKQKKRKTKRNKQNQDAFALPVDHQTCY